MCKKINNEIIITDYGTFRSIVKKCTVPTYFPEKGFVSFFSILPPPPHVIKTTVEVIQIIKDINIGNNSIIRNFEIVSLHPSIPILEIQDFIINSNKNNQEFNSNRKNIIIFGLNLIMNKNLFVFNNTYYKQTKPSILMNFL